MESARAFLFGATVAAAVGPIALLIVHIGLHHGLRAAAWSALGVALADLTYAMLAFGAGATLLAVLHAHRRLFALAASAALLLLGLWLLVGTVRQLRTGRLPEPARAVGLRSSYLLTLANPLTLILFAGFAGQTGTASGWLGAAVNAGALFLGSLIVQLMFALSGASLQRALRSPPVIAGAGVGSALGICLFGAWGLMSGH
jgi:threonine/homoserine/homoserine lactone efflux protein